MNENCFEGLTLEDCIAASQICGESVVLGNGKIIGFERIIPDQDATILYKNIYR